MARPISGTSQGVPISAECEKCGAAHDPARCQGHVDDAKRAAYEIGGPAARARAKGNLRQCKHRPRRGMTVCADHGGSAPQVEQVAATRVAMAEAVRAMQTYGVKLDTDPVQALLDEVCWTAGHVAWLRERVREIEQDALVWGRTEQVEKMAGEFPGVDTTEAAKPHVFVVLYQQERKHLLDACKAAIAAGIAEREVRLAEKLGDKIVLFIDGVFGDLRLSQEQRAIAKESVPRHLRAVA